MRLVVFGDTHITPDSSEKTIRALEGLAKFCIHNKVDTVVNLGDIASFNSLARTVSAKGKYETEEELETVFKVYDKYFFGVFDRHNDELRQSHTKLYIPHHVLCLGNHDSRVSQQVTEFFEARKATVVPYCRDITISKYVFSHSFTNGRSGKICSSTDEILNSTLVNSVSGHGHVREVSETKTRFGERLTAIRIPCLNFDNPEWAGNTSLKWDRGFMLMLFDESLAGDYWIWFDGGAVAQ